MCYTNFGPDTFKYFQIHLLKEIRVLIGFGIKKSKLIEANRIIITKAPSNHFCLLRLDFPCYASGAFEYKM